MARTNKKPRVFSAGRRNRNRVRVFECPKTGIFQIEWRQAGKPRQRSLKHRDFEKAKDHAEEIAAKLASQPSTPLADQPKPPLTLGKLFEMYLEEVTPNKGLERQKHDVRALATFESIFGSDREPRTLSKRDWDKFCRLRAEGSIGPSGKPVSPRAVEYDLRTLLAVLNWAVRSNADDGSPLLERNPWAGLKPPTQKNPNRPVLDRGEYEALLAIADKVDWRFEVALVLAYETGHRIGSIRQLRWRDIDLANLEIVWPAENEKNGHEHVVPITQEAGDALQKARNQNPGIGDAPVFPAPQNASKCVGYYLMRDWWRRAERLAGLERIKGRGWHSLRRRFASDLMDQPLKVVCDVGGWKSHRTVVECYQQPNEERLREALTGRKRA